MILDLMISDSRKYQQANSLDLLTYFRPFRNTNEPLKPLQMLGNQGKSTMGY